MKNSKILNTILLISGLIAAGVGVAILLVPVAFYAGNGVDLGANSSLLNEIRATGGGLLACGILIMSGAFVAKLRFTAIVICMLIYLAYGLSRLLGMAMDGMPTEGLVNAAVLEIIIGLLSVFAFLKYRENK